jgi:hypothetical protein
MFRVWWLQEALDDVAAQWIGADAELRQAITEAAHQIDVLLARDPLGRGEPTRRSTARIRAAAWLLLPP